jgi:hypothetical protein
MALRASLSYAAIKSASDIPGGIVLVSSISLLGALGASGDQDEAPPHASSTGTTPPPQEDGGYILTQHDKDYADFTWDRTTKAKQRTFCARVGDGITHAELEDGWV